MVNDSCAELGGKIPRRAKHGPPGANSLRLAALEGENERVNRDRFRQSHADNADGQNVPERARITANGLSRRIADEADGNSGTRARHPQGEGAIGTLELREFSRIGRRFLHVDQ